MCSLMINFLIELGLFGGIRLSSGFDASRDSVWPLVSRTWLSGKGICISWFDLSSLTCALLPKVLSNSTGFIIEVESFGPHISAFGWPSPLTSSYPETVFCFRNLSASSVFSPRASSRGKSFESVCWLASLPGTVKGTPLWSGDSWLWQTWNPRASYGACSVSCLR